LTTNQDKVLYTTFDINSIDGKLIRMEFITDDFELAASTICDLYKARWDIEIFFKQLKQTLKLSDSLDIMKMQFNGKYGWHC